MKSSLQAEENVAPLGIRLRMQRKLLKLSQEEVGVAIGLDESCSRARISRYEIGVHEPSIETVKKLATVLKVPTVYLYCERNSLAKLILEIYFLTDSEIDLITKKIQQGQLKEGPEFCLNGASVK